MVKLRSTFTLYLYHLRHQTTLNAIMETSLAFCDERYTGSALLSVGNKTSNNSCSAHFTLLRAFPAIRMCQNVSDLLFNGVPQSRPICMCFLDVAPRALVKVSKKIGEDLQHRFVGGKWRDTSYCRRSGRDFWAKMKFEPIASNVSFMPSDLQNKIYHSAFVHPSFSATPSIPS